MKKFALIGAAGYVAPRHMKAIKETGNDLVAALDKNDSVGIIDSYFPESTFFTEFERFDRHLDMLRRKGHKIDYLSIVSPNYLHDSHIRFALRSSANAICEKPLVLNPWNIDAIKEVEKETGKQVYNILQLRLHPSIVKLKNEVQNILSTKPGKVFDIDLTYITSRGNWYYNSWKGDVHKSGGIASNIGVHFFDMLLWIFGSVKENIVHANRAELAAGYLELTNAKIRWFLTIDNKYLPIDAINCAKTTYRSIRVDGSELEFSEGFTDLHTESYRDILSGGGFSLEEARGSIEIVHHIRDANTVGLSGDYHPLAKHVMM